MLNFPIEIHWRFLKSVLKIHAWYRWTRLALLSSKILNLANSDHQNIEIYRSSFSIQTPIGLTLFPIDFHVKILIDRKWPNEVSTNSGNHDDSRNTNHTLFRLVVIV